MEGSVHNPKSPLAPCETSTDSMSSVHPPSPRERSSMFASSSWGSFQQRGFIFVPKGRLISAWDWLICATVPYSTVFTPLSMVFVHVRWKGWLTLEYVLCVLWLLDVCIVKMRTSYKEHGYDITDWRRIVRRHLQTYFWIDFLACFPFSAPCFAVGLDPFDITSPASAVQLFSLLRLVRLLRRVMRLTGPGASVIVILCSACPCSSHAERNPRGVPAYVPACMARLSLSQTTKPDSHVLAFARVLWSSALQ